MNRRANAECGSVQSQFAFLLVRPVAAPTVLAKDRLHLAGEIDGRAIRRRGRSRIGRRDAIQGRRERERGRDERGNHPAHVGILPADGSAWISLTVGPTKFKAAEWASATNQSDGTPEATVARCDATVILREPWRPKDLGWTPSCLRSVFEFSPSEGDSQRHGGNGVWYAVQHTDHRVSDEYWEWKWKHNQRRSCGVFGLRLD